MCYFTRKKKKKAPDDPIFTLEEIAGILHNKNLAFSDEIVDVIYSCDNTKRYVVLKRVCDGNYTFVYEKIEVLDAEELHRMKAGSVHPAEVLPAYWVPIKNTRSIFGTLDEAFTGIRLEPEYKLYF